MKRLPLIASFLLFVALCASVAYWAMQLFKPPPRPVAAPPRAARVETAPEAAAALFGGRQGKVAVASNYQLKGVILSGTARDSVAILSADGKPAQAVRVDMEVAPGVTVKEVHREYVLLSEGGATKRVELPESVKMQVELAAAPAATQGVTPQSQPQPQPQPARGLPVPAVEPTQAAPAPTSSSAAQTNSPRLQQPSTAGQTPGATQTGQAPSPRSPLLPPAAQQNPAQAQVQQPTPPQTQTAPATPATVVVSPPPSVQSPVPAMAPAAGIPAASAPLTAPPPATAPGAPAAAPVVSPAGEHLPPPALQSR